MLIDTHAHLMLPEFAEDLDAVLDRAKARGLGKIMNLGCSIETTEKSIALTQHAPMLYGSCGVHPYDAQQVTDALMSQYEQAFKNNSKLVAIGETGLDYHREGSLIEAQKEGFKKHLELARAIDMPIIIHCREAQEDVLKLLDMFKGVKGVVHCFSYDLQLAKEIWKRGILTSFTGIITYPNVKNLLEVVKYAPLDMIMVETDSPYLAPQAFRSKRNEPAYVTYVADKIAEVKGVPFDEIADRTTKNALTLFSRLSG